MDVFKSYYQDLRKKRSIIDNDGLGKTYKRVIGEYNHCMDIEEYVVSFLLIQNLLEDRLYVLYRLMDIEKHTNRGMKYKVSMEHYHKNVNLWKVIDELSDFGLLTDELKKHLLTSVNIRNKHIHFSFMDIDSFDKELSESFYMLFREIDRIVQKFKTVK